MLVLPCGGQPIPQEIDQRPDTVPPINFEVLPVEQRPVLPAFMTPSMPGDFPIADNVYLAWFASLARSTYAPNADPFNQLVRAALGPAAIVTYAPNDPTTTPGTGFIFLPQVIIAVISGTTNFNQWMNNLFNTSLSPTNFGTGAVVDPARCGAFYRTAATGVEARYPAAAATLPMIFVGHSLGGAVAEVLVYKRRLNGRRGDKLVTFGSPKPGDAALAAGIAQTGQYLQRVANPGDFIPTLPPDLGILQLAVPLQLQPAATTWASYRQVGPLKQTNDQGGLDQVDEQTFPLAAAGAMAAVAAGSPMAPTTPHVMKTTYDRLRVGFPTWNLPGLRGWPAPESVDEVNAQLTALGV